MECIVIGGDGDDAQVVEVDDIAEWVEVIVEPDAVLREMVISGVVVDDTVDQTC